VGDDYFSHHHHPLLHHPFCSLSSS
jgi:hypothetical protein